MSISLNLPPQLLLGKRENRRVPLSEHQRQRREAQEILRRLDKQPGVILADEVGMGKTFVALAVAYCIGIESKKGPVVVMVPPNILEKWEQDLDAFATLYLDGVKCKNTATSPPPELRKANVLRYGVARNSVDFLKLLDDSPRERSQIVFLAQGAMSRAQTDPWVLLYLIRETLRRHGRRANLKKIKKNIHRFIAKLLAARGIERASEEGDQVWSQLLRSDPENWMELYNATLKNPEPKNMLTDDPVPAAIVKAVQRVDLDMVANSLAAMPVRESANLADRIYDVRIDLRETERGLWKEIIAVARWRSPLLILDEAHHLKNPKTALARQLQDKNSAEDLKLGDSAMAGAFDRMLFLTATPFQLGHYELVRVLQRFGDVRWKKNILGEKESFQQKLEKINECLTASQRAAVRLRRAWSRLEDEDFDASLSVEAWWKKVVLLPAKQLAHRQKTLVDAFQQSVLCKDEAERHLRPWVIRHNKGKVWPATETSRRQRFDGAAIHGESSATGIDIPDSQLLPFFLAARSASRPGKDLLGEALCSSYEAFRHTRQDNLQAKDDIPEEEEVTDLSHSQWFLNEFDSVISQCSAGMHPKLYRTVQKAVDLWEAGEKVLVFAFYRHTCRALRIHISNELEKRIMTHARRRLAGAGRASDDASIAEMIDRIQNRFFDSVKAPGRQQLDLALGCIVKTFSKELHDAEIEEEVIIDVMRRYLRVQTTLVRVFPIHEHDALDPEDAVKQMLDSEDASGLSWREKFERLLDFLLCQCAPQERKNYVEAAERINTGRIRVQADEVEHDASAESIMALPNIQVATGSTRRDTRARLMRAFNTPFFPDILVCSQVMGEGVDLHRYCRHVIHHDLDWNPSSIEQRTGRVDRLGCKAEGRASIPVFVPYLAGTADERQYQVMTDRESWFRIVMGQEEVAKLITEQDDTEPRLPPEDFQERLAFDLSLR